MEVMEQSVEQVGLNAETDCELVRRVAVRKDTQAYAEIARRHGGMVYRVCLRITHDGADAEDARQAVFLVLLQKAGSVRSGSSLMSWLHGVARRISLGIVRDRERRMKTQDELRQALEHEKAGDMYHQADRDELLGWLDAELEALPRKLREAVILRYLEDRSQEEAAVIAGCPQGTLAWRAKEGLDRLRERLARRSAALAPALLPDLLKGEAHAFAPSLPLGLPGQAVAASAAGAAGASAKAALLAKGVLKAMFWTKTAVLAASFVGATAMVGGIVVAGGELKGKADSSGKSVSVRSDIRKPYASLLELVMIEPDRAKAEASESGHNLRFVGTISLPNGEKKFQINLAGDKKTYFAKIGEEVEGYRLVNYQEKIGRPNASAGNSPISVDKSVLVLEKDNKRVELVRNIPRTIMPDDGQSFAVFIFAVGNTTIRAGKGDRFELLDEQYAVKDIAYDQSSVVVQNLDDGREFVFQMKDRYEPLTGGVQSEGLAAIHTRVVAKNVEYDARTKRGHYMGNAIYSNNLFTIAADEMLIESSQTSSLYSITAIGNVTLKTAKTTGTCDRLTLDNVTSNVVMTGNARLAKGSDVVTGDRVAWSLNNSEVESTGHTKLTANPNGAAGAIVHSQSDIYGKYGKAMAEMVVFSQKGPGGRTQTEWTKDLQGRVKGLQLMDEEMQKSTGGVLPVDGVKSITTVALSQLGIKLKPDSGKKLDGLCAVFAKAGGNSEMTFEVSDEGFKLKASGNLGQFLQSLPALVAPEDQEKAKAILSGFLPDKQNKKDDGELL
jgi:lipopolysaccharide transport protein LptA